MTGIQALTELKKIALNSTLCVPFSHALGFIEIAAAELAAAGAAAEAAKPAPEATGATDAEPPADASNITEMKRPRKK
jgi:hypothetical protein